MVVAELSLAADQHGWLSLILVAGMGNNDEEREGKRAGREKENLYKLLTRLHITENGSPCAMPCAVGTR